jgi:hypothetical protein
MVSRPALLPLFPSEFQRGIRQESSPNPQLISHWENTTFQNHQKIEALLAVRSQQAMQQHANVTSSHNTGTI